LFSSLLPNSRLGIRPGHALLPTHQSIQPSNCLLNVLRINLVAQASGFMRRFLDSCVSVP
jgi:hypothetical protein